MGIKKKQDVCIRLKILSSGRLLKHSNETSTSQEMLLHVVGQLVRHRKSKCMLLTPHTRTVGTHASRVHTAKARGPCLLCRPGISTKDAHRSLGLQVAVSLTPSPPL
jgi:hypothetical protein